MNIEKKVRHWAVDNGWELSRIVVTDPNGKKHEGWLWKGPKGQKAYCSIGLWDCPPTVPPRMIMEWEEQNEEISKKEAKEIGENKKIMGIKLPKDFFGGAFKQKDDTQTIYPLD